MIKTKPIDIELARSLFNYDPMTGLITHKHDKLAGRGMRAIKARKGDEAGTMIKGGYRQIYINKSLYLSSRVAFAMFHGVDPGNMFIDHIDGCKINNRIENLRLVDNKSNQRNSISDVKVRTNNGHQYAYAQIRTNAVRKSFHAPIAKHGRDRAIRLAETWHIGMKLMHHPESFVRLCDKYGEQRVLDIQAQL